MKNPLQHILVGCRENNPGSQKMLYELYAPIFMSIAYRYTGQRQIAEDVMISAFGKIFDKISSFSNTGSFEGWMKRIVINEALMTIRKFNKLNVVMDVKHHDIENSINVVDKLQYNELLDLMDLLPNGYRTIFNLYVIEGYKHREIAELLGISINTSKSQLILAKKRMRKLIDNLETKKKQINKA